MRCAMRSEIAIISLAAVRGWSSSSWFSASRVSTAQRRNRRAGGRPRGTVEQTHFADQAAGAEYGDRDRRRAADHDRFDRDLAIHDQQHEVGVIGVAFPDEGRALRDPPRLHVGYDGPCLFVIEL